MNAFQFGQTVKAALGHPRMVEDFRGEAGALSVPVDSLAEGRPAFNPPSAPPRPMAPRDASPLNYAHGGGAPGPQMQGLMDIINKPNARGVVGGLDPRYFPNQPAGRIPYPIRGAGQMGSVPTLTPRDAGMGGMPKR